MYKTIQISCKQGSEIDEFFSKTERRNELAQVN